MESRSYTNSRFTMQASWQSEIAHAFRNPQDLLKFLGIDEDRSLSREQPFPFLVTEAFARRMIKGNPSDPLLLQVLPRVQETDLREGYSSDPVGDLRATLAPGLIQKYRHRALIITTGACAIHCRYCFRRDFPYQEKQSTRSRWSSQLDILREDPSIEEVILSGGDPLMLSNERIAEILEDLSQIPHIERIRIHSRMPVVLPSRIDAGLIEIVRSYYGKTVMVIHSNHPNELDESVAFALKQLRTADVMLLNQSVLLRGINDQEDILVRLSKRLHSMHVLPYYLHALDRATGTAHFEVPLAEAKALMKRMGNGLPGYLVPKFVQEIAGEPSKTLVY